MGDEYAIRECPAQNNTEVIDMCFSEFDAEMTRRFLIEDARMEALQALACKKALVGKPVKEIAEWLDVSAETVTQWLVAKGIIKPAPAPQQKQDDKEADHTNLAYMMMFSKEKAQAFREGKAEGKEEGRDEERLCTVRKMYNRGDSIEAIASFYGVTSETVDQWLAATPTEPAA